MREKVLITGASGFVGYHLILGALKKDLDVYAAVRPGSNTSHLASLPVRFTTPDFHNPALLLKDITENGYDYIIHAAGSTRAKTQQEYDRANAEITRNLASAAVQAPRPVKKFVFISSLAAIGPNTDDDRPISSDRTPAPVTAYGKSKLLAEQYLAQLDMLPLTTIRPTAVYGPRERDLFVIIKSIRDGLEPYIGSRDQQLSFVYVSDLAGVTLQALETGKRAAYNISDGNSYDRYRFAEITKKILGRRTLKFNIPLSAVKAMAWSLEKLYSFSDRPPVLNLEKINELTAPNWACSIEPAACDLGYAPEYDLEKGLKETIGWYKKNGWLK